MSFMNNVGNMNLNNGAPSAPTAPIAPASVASAPKPPQAVETAKSAKAEEFKRKGAILRSNMSDEERAAEGAKAEDIEFLACLGNPAHPRSRATTNKGADGRNMYDKTLLVVGYKLMAHAPVDVPVCPLKPDCQSYLDVNMTDEKKHVEAGQEFNVNVMEMAVLASRPEYAGFFKGGGKSARLGAAINSKRETPTPTLTLEEGGKTKDGMIEIATNVGGVNGKGGTWHVKDEYQEFAPLFVKKRASRGTSAKAKAAGEATKNTAAAFRALFGTH